MPVPRETSDTPADVHLPWFWTLWRRNQAWRDNLARRATHKALDIPEDDMQISVRQGMGWKELAVVALLTAGGVAGGMYLADRRDAPTAVPPVQAPAPPPTAQAFEPVRGSIRFWVEDKAGTTQLGEHKVQ
jgi:hypothetical protein